MVMAQQIMQSKRILCKVDCPEEEHPPHTTDCQDLACVQPPEKGGQDAGGFQGLMTTFGAVKVGGRNFFKLLQNGEAVLLFPGGVREVRSLAPAAHTAGDIPQRLSQLACHDEIFMSMQPVLL